MIRIADYIESTEPIGHEGQFYKAWRSDGQLSAIQVFPFQLSGEEFFFFKEQVSLLNGVITGDHAAIPSIRSWGFTQTDNLPFIETEWIEGYDLAKLNAQKEVTLGDVGSVAEQISRVLTLCHNRGLVHGNLTSEKILWDVKKQRYVLTGFCLGMHLQKTTFPGRINSAQPNTLSSSHSELQQKDIHDLGFILLRLLKDNLFLNPKSGWPGVDATSLRQEKLKDGNLVPAWMATCIEKALSNSNEEKFSSAGEMYHYILLHHKTPAPLNIQYRSKPYTTVPSSGKPKPAKSSKKVNSLMASGIERGKKEMRFVFDSRIAIGLIVAGLLVGFSIIAQNRQNEKQKDALAYSGTNLSTPQLDSTINVSEDNSKATPAKTSSKQKKETGKIKAATSKKTAPQIHSITQPTTDSNANNNLGAFKVKSKAYFHNQPDESTRRNAFIVHWNNAVLHPLKEENDFVYIVFINEEGQTSKGWLRKKDLIKL